TCISSTSTGPRRAARAAPVTKRIRARCRSTCARPCRSATGRCPSATRRPLTAASARPAATCPRPTAAAPRARRWREVNNMALSTIRIAALAAVTLATVTAAAAVAVADDRPAIGTAAPLPAVHDLAGRAPPLSEIQGRRGLGVLFWARWSDRSVEELKRLDAASPDLAAHGVTVAAVNVDRVEPDAADTTTLRAQIDALQVRVPVFVDRGLELFHTYGVVTVPSTAVVDERG